MTDWFSELQKAKKSCIVEGNLKKIHYQLNGNKEMVEEYDLTTNCLTRRAWRCNKELKGEDSWEIEIGDPEPKFNGEAKNWIRESSNEPFVTRRITKRCLEWRIRNLPYPKDVYLLDVDKEECRLIIKTTNKKYFKILPVPDLQRLNIVLEEENLSFDHKFNTLIITYKKPKKLLDFEGALMEEIKKIKPRYSEEDIDGCKPS